MTRQQQTDEELVTWALTGSAEAHRLLVERFQRPVLSLVGRMVRDPGLAEDLAQEAFIRAFKKLDTFDGKRKFSSWLFKIAHNRTIDHLRRKRPAEVALEASDGEDETWEVLALPGTSSPQRQVESSELGTILNHAIGELRPNYREILLLRFQQGLAYHEIAEVMDLTMGTVKIQLHRARKRLILELAKAGVTAPEVVVGGEP